MVVSTIETYNSICDYISKYKGLTIDCDRDIRIASPDIDPLTLSAVLSKEWQKRITRHHHIINYYTECSKYIETVCMHPYNVQMLFDFHTFHFKQVSFRITRKTTRSTNIIAYCTRRTFLTGVIVSHIIGRRISKGTKIRLPGNVDQYKNLSFCHEYWSLSVQW